MPDQRRRLLVVGWDAADWDIITPLVEAGRMPHLARLMKNGAWGNLASLRPCLTPMLWTTIATGHTADRHGVLGFAEPLPDHSGIITTRSTTRRVPALWNMLAAKGRRSCVITWPVSDPPEEIPGVYVSAGALETLAGRLADIHPLPCHVVHPPEQAETLSDWRFHPCELALTDLQPFIPDVTGVDLTRDLRPEKLARIYARSATTHALATGLMEQEHWDLCAVYYEAIDRTGHDFMALRPPMMSGVPPEEAQRYGGVVDAMYEFHDAMLGRLLELAGPETCVCVLSDHGFQSGAGRPAYTPHTGSEVAEEGAEWHRMMGMIVLHGPGVRAGERIHGASLLDVLPTLLAWQGLPVGHDMPGAVMQRAFAPALKVEKIQTWDASWGPVRAAGPPGQDEAEQHFAVLRQLAALGYLEEASLAGEKAVLHSLRESKFNLALVHLHHSRPAAALAPLQELCAEQTQPHLRYELTRLEALRATGMHTGALAILDKLENAGLSGLGLDLAAAASLYATGQPETAGARLQRALTACPENPDLLTTAGRMAQLGGGWSAAEHFYRSALAVDPSHAPAHGGMAAVCLQNGKPESTLEHALISLKRYFYNPELHWVLAQALDQLGDRIRAVEACRQALIMAPSLHEARMALARWSSAPY